MPRPRKAQPAYLHHKPTNQAYVRIPDGNGGRKTVYLGEHASAESKVEYRRLLAELDAAASPAAVIRAEPKLKAARDVLVSEVYRDFWAHAQQHYRRADGSPTNELPQYRQTFRIVLDLYGGTPAAEFGPLALKAVRLKMVEAGWTRKLVNQRVGRVKRVFKWATSEQLVPVATYTALATVTGLQAGRTTAPDPDPVEPVADEIVDATLPHLNRHVRGMVEFQRLTGCRPGEACVVRRADIDTGGAVWLYRPKQHKTAWRGKPRTIAIGPKAQELLKEFFTPNLDDYLFSPRRAVEEFHAERSANRKTPKYASHMKRNANVRKANPQLKPAEVYDVNAYGHAIDRACNKAFPAPEPLGQRDDETAAEWETRLTDEQKKQLRVWQREHQWHPNQLRHAFATAVRKRHGLEAAQVLLGHERADVTQVYAERNEALAARVAAKIG
jgi:integrase